MVTRPRTLLLFPICLLVATLAHSALAAAEAPLAIEISSSREVCTIGTFTEISWAIGGGIAPYTLTINGSVIDPERTSERVLCGLAEGLDDPGQLNAFNHTVVRGTVVDGENQTSSGVISIRLSSPLPPPERAFAGVWQEWSDYRVASLYAGVDRQWSGGSRQHSASPSLFLVRWRPAGETSWSYLVEEEPDSGVWFNRSLQRVPVNAVYEVQLSQQRVLIEHETPEALRWTRVLNAVSAGPPRDVTVQTTSHSAVVAWQANRKRTNWKVQISPVGPDRSSGRSQETVSVGGQHSYSVEFSRLRADTAYSIMLWQDSPSVLPEATFDIRTEPERFDASYPDNGPRIMSVTPSIGARGLIGLITEWDSPTTGDETPYRVYAHEFATPIDWHDAPEVGSDRRQTLITGIRPDTLYRVVVERVDLHRTRDEVLIRTPAELFEDESVYRWQIPNLYVSWRTWNVSGREHRGFVAIWEPQYRDGYAQIQWQKDGRTMNRYGEAPVIIEVARPGSYRFRARFRKNDRWSEWTAWQHETTRPEPPSNDSVRVSERAGAIEIEWSEAGRSLTPVDAYRVYVRGIGDLEQVFDVSGRTGLRIPLAGAENSIEVQIASVSEQHGVGPRSLPVAVHTGIAPSLINTNDVRCDPYGGLLGILRWQIRGGAAPFLIHPEGQEPFETVESSGEMVVHCGQVAEDGTLSKDSVTLSVEDAYGRRDELNVTASPIPLYQDQEDRSVSITPVSVFSVTDSEARLGWPCLAWKVFGWGPRPPAVFQLRWRTRESSNWSYQEIVTRTLGPKLGDVCRWIWRDLAPGTTYEFQIAHVAVRSESIRAEGLHWTHSESFTTLGEARNVVVRRVGANVEVTWDAQPDAWLHQMILRGEHTSWWKLYRPNGEDSERAIFEDIPFEDEMAVEIVSPPEFRRKPLIGPGFQRYIPPH